MELPTLFSLNELLVISDGLETRLGTLTAGREWFKPWRTISGERVEDMGVSQLEVLLKGVFDRWRFLQLIYGISSSSRTTAAGNSTRRSPVTTSSTQYGSPWKRPCGLVEGKPGPWRTRAGDTRLADEPAGGRPIATVEAKCSLSTSGSWP